MLGGNVSLRSLYDLRDNAGYMRQPSSHGAGAFAQRDLAGSRGLHTPGVLSRNPAFGGGGGQGTTFHFGHLRSLRTRLKEPIITAGQLGVALTTMAPAPVDGSTVPSFGSYQAPRAPQPLDGAVVPQPIGGRVLGRVVPSPQPPIGFAPTPAPTPTPTTPSSGLPWLVAGGAVLALLYFGTQDKRKRRRAA